MRERWRLVREAFQQTCRRSTTDRGSRPAFANPVSLRERPRVYTAPASRTEAGDGYLFLFTAKEKQFMRKMVIAGVVALGGFATGVALAEKVQDWHDLEAVHAHVVEAIQELDRARAANHYDMAGHGAKAEELLHQAERELHQAVEASKAAH
jgi:hypothetical protein